jgi:hypothetical protein
MWTHETWEQRPMMQIMGNASSVLTVDFLLEDGVQTHGALQMNVTTHMFLFKKSYTMTVYFYLNIT